MCSVTSTRTRVHSDRRRSWFCFSALVARLVSRTMGGEVGRFASIGDPAVLPLVLLLASILLFVLTPILNTHTRTFEHEADMYGINASRQPDGFAQAAIHLGGVSQDETGPGQKNGSSSIIRAAITAFTTLCAGRRKT